MGLNEFEDTGAGARTDPLHRRRVAPEKRTGLNWFPPKTCEFSAPVGECPPLPPTPCRLDTPPVSKHPKTFAGTGGGGKRGVFFIKSKKTPPPPLLPPLF